MKLELAEVTYDTVKFLVLKSYDGGKNWERERQFDDFVSAADLAQALRTEHPSIRFRVDVAAGRRRRRRA